jgi:hypothetical protein
MLLRNRTKSVEMSTAKLGLFPSLAKVPYMTLRITYNIKGGGGGTLGGNFNLKISLPKTGLFSGHR